MKLPGVAMAAAFACGIALGLCPAIAQNSSFTPFLLSLFCAASFFLLTGFLLLRLGRGYPATGSSLLCWFALGTLSACLSQQPLHSNRARGDQRTPLRWHGWLLKIGHHGSKNSTTAEFLDSVHPQFGMISDGENNPYGHPSPELLERLPTAGLQVFRTDRDGAIHVLTDGSRIEIRCSVRCSGRAGESLAMQRMEKP